MPLVLLAAAVGLALYFVNNKVQKTPELPEPPLKALASERSIKVGNFAMPKLLGEKPYSDILSGQFDFVLIDNQPNWKFTDYSLRPSRDKFDFTRIDEVVKYARDNQMGMQFHHFLWGEEKWLPDWLLNGNYSKQELLDIIKDHILTVGQQYKDAADEWTVVNEAFTRSTNVYGLHDWWFDNLEGDMQAYIDNAFIWARQADSDAVLILNDFNNEGQNEISDAMYEYIKGAKQRGVPIDGIGMQMHIDGAHPTTKEEVIANMKRFGELGVLVYVTEFDVNMNYVQADSDGRNNIQANIYFEMMRACIESKVCPSFAILGITDKETWYKYTGNPNPSPLPFDEFYKPKPAFFSLRNALEQAGTNEN